MLRFIFTLIVKRQTKFYGTPLNVNFYSKVTKNTILKNNVNFNGFRVDGGGKVTVGNNFHSGKNIILITQIHNYEGEMIPYDNTFVYKDIIIEDNVWFGHNVTVLGGVTIGEGSIIQAGSVVVKDIPAYGIAGGNPAKVFKYRNKEHYESLKRLKRFN